MTLSAFLPELWLCGVALVVLVADLVLPRRLFFLSPTVAAFGLLGSVILVGNQLGGPPASIFSGSYVLDGFVGFFKLLFVACGLLVILLSVDFFRREEAYGEYFSFIVFLVLGMCLLAGANDLVTIYLSFELVSLTSYLLAAWRKGDRKSNEAGVKYFIYGAAASAVMLYGLTLIYAAGGSTHLTTLAAHLIQPEPGGSVAGIAAVGVVLMAVGLGYKISMAPFHAWAPDVYEGAPTPVTALLSVGPKAAGFAILLRVFYALGPRLAVPWQMVFAVLATLTMFVGNLLAIRQSNVKRMLAYSSIAHAGYLLIGVAVGPDDRWASSGVLVYLTAYLLMNLGLFGVAVMVERATGSAEISGFAGLARGAPGLAALTILFLLSLTGIPPTAGFLGKFYLFAAAIRSQDWAWLAVVGIINSVISLYYYMNIARMMYFAREAPAQMERMPVALTTAVVVSAAGTLLLFVFPGWLLEAASIAVAVR